VIAETDPHLRHCRGTIAEEDHRIGLVGVAEVPIHFLLTALLGKAAVTTASKGFAAKSSAAGAKSASGHHAHRRLAKKVAGKIVDKVRDDVIDRAVAKVDAKRAKAQGCQR
jgi:hypothetical protein